MDVKIQTQISSDRMCGHHLQRFAAWETIVVHCVRTDSQTQTNYRPFY